MIWFKNDHQYTCFSHFNRSGLFFSVRLILLNVVGASWRHFVVALKLYGHRSVHGLGRLDVAIEVDSVIGVGLALDGDGTGMSHDVTGFNCGALQLRELSS